MQTNQFDLVLDALASGRKDASLTLRDGTFITGRIKEFDAYVVILDGEPMRMVYRHSILKLSEAAARTQAERRPSPGRPAHPPDRPRSQASQDRPSRPPRDRRSRPDGRPVSDGRPARQDAPEPSAPMGIMGDAMRKWLESQKGGE